MAATLSACDAGQSEYAPECSVVRDREALLRPDLRKREGDIQLQKLNLGVLASGGGSNLQAIIDNSEAGRIDATVCVVISNNSGSGALARARKHGIPAIHLSSRTCPTPEALDHAILDTIREHRVALVVLAGYMKKLGPRTLAAYDNRILNIHPALLPSFGGEGMYGHHVHEAVLDSGAKVSGVTVHLVNPQYDQGPIVAQRVVAVLDDDSPEELAARVLREEHKLYSEVIQWFAEGRVYVEGGRARVGSAAG
jgi:phosphoribosylglycinamide formyltransferase-1